MVKGKIIAWFKEISKEDISLAGGKGANLGEMYNAGIPVPNGFVVIANAYFAFIKQNHLGKQIRDILAATNINNTRELEEASRRIRALILQTPLSDSLSKLIIKAYNKLGRLGGLKQPYVAIRSSGTAEDLPGASFAGQQETFLNVHGEHQVVKKVQACWASLFTPRAIFYRQEKHFDHLRIGIAVPVQKMVQADISGVMFSVNPVINDKSTLVIEAIWGLGELIVQGEITPDHYEIDKQTLRIKKTVITEQKIELIRRRGITKRRLVPKSRRQTQKLNPFQIIQLAKFGLELQQHYYFPQDSEWAIEKGKFYIVQTRPITTLSQNEKISDKKSKISKKTVILIGQSAAPGLVTGPVKIIASADKLSKMKKGDVLVTSMTTPDFVPAMKKAAAIVTDRGGQTSHAAIVSRELAVPCVVGTQKATKILSDGEMVTVDGSSGKIFKASRTIKNEKALSSKKILRVKATKTATKLYVNLAEPDLASEIARLNVDGVGLLRAEFMIAGIGIHPQELIQEKKQQFFINTLAHDIATFCRHFGPRPVVYRATDFKTNEYRHLRGGEKFEEEEENPLLGFRGAMRYLNTPEIFGMELAAIKKVRKQLGYRNLWLMIPFVRTPSELQEIKKMLATAGLERSSSFKLWIMVEVPSTVIRVNDFLDVGIDGVSIGSNDLTMLLLGLDRDNSRVAWEFNDQDKTVLWAIKRVIKATSKAGVTSSICGQAPSNHPRLVKKLVKWGITSISVNPDVIDKTRNLIAQVEKKLIAG